VLGASTLLVVSIYPTARPLSSADDVIAAVVHVHRRDHRPLSLGLAQADHQHVRIPLNDSIYECAFTVAQTSHTAVDPHGF
jgi:hypothetical protein